MSEQCSSTGDVCILANTVNVLRNEVMRLNVAVNKLEAHAAGRVVRTRDLALTAAGMTLSVSSVVWVLNMLGVVP